jgi:ribosomal protein S18 acetylase RimI-like enzyme
MAVVPNARGRRVGWRLLVVMEEFARRLGLARMYLSTTPFLDRAIRLYERYGFTRTDEPPHEMSGTPLFTMTKQVTRSDREPEDPRRS